MFAVKSSFNMVWIVLLFISSFSTRKIRIVCYLQLSNDNEDDKDDDDDDGGGGGGDVDDNDN